MIFLLYMNMNGDEERFGIQDVWLERHRGNEKPDIFLQLGASKDFFLHAISVVLRTLLPLRLRIFSLFGRRIYSLAKSQKR